jgi:hypothetical protein
MKASSAHLQYLEISLLLNVPGPAEQMGNSLDIILECASSLWQLAVTIHHDNPHLLHFGMQIQCIHDCLMRLKRLAQYFSANHPPCPS